MSISGGLVNGIKLVESDSPKMREMDREYEGFANLQGVDYSELDKKFTSGSLKLIEGKHITYEDKGKALIHKELAELNNLKIGDKISIKGSPLNRYSIKKDGEVSLEIIGIYDSEDKSKSKSMMDMIQNYILCDNESIMELDGYREGDMIYHYADFEVNDPEKLDSITAKVKKLPVDWKKYRISRNSEVFTTLTKSIKNLDSLINTVLIGIIIVGVILLSLILTFWIRGRIKETGILLSIGIPKNKVIYQYIIELLMIAVLGFGLSYLSGQAVAQSVGNKLVAQASDQSRKELQKGMGGQSFGSDPDTQLLKKTIDGIDVNVTFSEMIYVFVIGAMIIVVSVIISSIPIINLKPKDILSKMS